MDRRAFIVGGMAALATPITVTAQQAGKVHRVGLLAYLPPGPGANIFRDELRKLGYVEGKNLVIERRSAQPDPARYPLLAAELVAERVDVIVAVYNQAIIAAKPATTSIPIVGVMVLEPVEMGIVKSLARPGGNITGVTWEEGTDQVGKKLELFKQLVPKATRMAAIWNPTVPGLGRYWAPLRAAATSLGMAVYSVEYSQDSDLDRALETIAKDRPNAIFFWGDSVSFVRRQELCEFALKNRLPALSPSRSFTEAGCLISYVPNEWEQYQRGAIYVDKILRGAKPADVPMERPTQFELLINGKTAKALGLTIPTALQARGAQIIE